jgi:type IV pilus assembly protein PilO
MNNARTTSLWRERLTSPLTWHYAGFAVLLVLVIGLSIRLGMDWAATNSHSADVLAGKQVQLKALDLETAPLRGLDKRVEDSRSRMRAFYEKRIPPTYSSISTRIGELQVSSGVRLSRVQYTQGPPGSDLTEISADAGISGDYPQIMRFVNSIERDQTFFIIRAMALTGQQGGLVNLRLRVSTWLRPADAAASGLPTTPPEGETPSPAPTPAPAGGKEGE